MVLISNAFLRSPFTTNFFFLVIMMISASFFYYFVHIFLFKLYYWMFFSGLELLLKSLFLFLVFFLCCESIGSIVMRAVVLYPGVAGETFLRNCLTSTN